MKALMIDPEAQTVTKIEFDNDSGKFPKLLGCDRVDGCAGFVFDADRCCEALFAGDCKNFEGPYLKFDHVHRHIHSKALIVIPNRDAVRRLEHESGIWIPGRGLYRNIWKWV